MQPLNSYTGDESQIHSRPKCSYVAFESNRMLEALVEAKNKGEDPLENLAAVFREVQVVSVDGSLFAIGGKLRLYLTPFALNRHGEMVLKVKPTIKGSGRGKGPARARQCCGFSSSRLLRTASEHRPVRRNLRCY